MYEIDYTDEALDGIAKLRKSNMQSYKKLDKLISELRIHPFTGTGHPEQLKYLPGIWSRHIDKKNKLRYIVEDTVITVTVISVLGHYDDR